MFWWNVCDKVQSVKSEIWYAKGATVQGLLGPCYCYDKDREVQVRPHSGKLLSVFASSPFSCMA